MRIDSISMSATKGAMTERNEKEKKRKEKKRKEFLNESREIPQRSEEDQMFVETKTKVQPLQGSQRLCVLQSVPWLLCCSTLGRVCVWLLSYGSLSSGLALAPNRVGLCFVSQFPWIPLWQQTIVVRVEKLYTWLNEEWACIVKASRLLVKITVTEKKSI